MRLSVITPTHDITYLDDVWASLKSQDHGDWEWVVLVNQKSLSVTRIQTMVSDIKHLTQDDPRVRIKTLNDMRGGGGVGIIKRLAFSHETGDALIELDHDDILLPSALSEIEQAFSDPGVGFVYSDFADFEDDRDDRGRPPPREDVQGAPIYKRGHTDERPRWEANGFEFYSTDLGGVRPGKYECVRAFPATALACSLMFWAPNHVRAWRRNVYEALGGHNPDWKICDDHELLIRTFGVTKFGYIPKPLYLYRVSKSNTWQKNKQAIETATWQLHHENIDALVRRECELRGLPAYDLGGGMNAAPGWVPVDRTFDEMDPQRRFVKFDLSSYPWPWETSSVGAFRAYEMLDKLPDKQRTMAEIWRCLAPGGWLLSMTPSTEGRGAFADPTSCSYWNPASFWYWTRMNSAKFIRNDRVRFQEVVLQTTFPSDWHKDHNLPLVQANLVALKDKYRGPGYIGI